MLLSDALDSFFRERNLSPLYLLPSWSAGFLDQSSNAGHGSGMGVLRSRRFPLHEGRRQDQCLLAALPDNTPRKGVLPGLLSVSLPHLPQTAQAMSSSHRESLACLTVTHGQKAVKPRPFWWAGDLHRASQA